MGKANHAIAWGHGQGGGPPRDEHVAILYFLIGMNKKLDHTSQTPPYYFWYSVVYIIYPKKKVFCWK